MKHAMVTGASSGIGKSFAMQLAEKGYALTLVARNEQRLSELKEGLKGDGHVIITADLSVPREVEKVCEYLKDTHHELLINNAGLGVYGGFMDCSWEELEFMQRVNCDALIKLSHVYLRHSHTGDALINVASVLSFLPYPFGGALYSASKSLVKSLSLALFEEQRPRQVYVMALCPGATATEFFDRAGGDPEKPPPNSIVQTPEQVVKEALAALKRRKQPIVVTGAKNKLIVFLSRLIAFRSQAIIMRKATPSMKEKSAR